MTSAAVVPRVRVTAPGTTPARFGLFSAASVLDGLDGTALNGIEYDTTCGVPVDLYPMPCAGQEVPPPYDEAVKEPRRTLSWVGADPFVVYVADDCHPLGRDATEARAQLRNRLVLGEQVAVERAIHTGELGQRPALAVDPEVLAGGTALQLPDALGVLEAWIAATTGIQGVIHAPRWVAPRLATAAWFTTSGQRALTPLGNVWSIGSGYPGGPPTGTADDGALWLYATGPVTVRRSAIVEPAEWRTGGFNQSTNAAFLLAERVYIVDWPCVVAAVKTQLQRPNYVPATPPEE